MKQVYLIALFIAASLAAAAQTSGLYVYDGGYFIKNGDSWEEYRPKDKAERWASYNQYGQETNYFNINNSSCSVSVPKTATNKFYIYKDNKWEPIYTTIAVYDWFPASEKGRAVYAYDGGYFVRDGNKWREYRPANKHELWAEYTQYGEEDNFFNINNSSCSVSVPKTTVNKFYIYRDKKWEPIYTTLAVLDSGRNSGSSSGSSGSSSSSGSYSASSSSKSYDYTLTYGRYFNDAASSNENHCVNSPVTLRISRKGYAELTWRGRTYNFDIYSAQAVQEESDFNILSLFGLDDSFEVIYFYLNKGKTQYIRIPEDGTLCSVNLNEDWFNLGESLSISDGSESNKSVYNTMSDLLYNGTFFR